MRFIKGELLHCVCICRESIDCMNDCCYDFNCYIVLDREMKIVKRGGLRFLIVLFSFSFSPSSSLLTSLFDLSIFVLLFSFSFSPFSSLLTREFDFNIYSLLDPFFCLSSSSDDIFFCSLSFSSYSFSSSSFVSFSVFISSIPSLFIKIFSSF